MAEKTRKPREVESSKEWAERLERDVRQRRADDAAEDDRIDAMVKRSIEFNGP